MGNDISKPEEEQQAPPVGGGARGDKEGWVEVPSHGDGGDSGGGSSSRTEALIGLGHAAAFLKSATVTAGIALLTVPEPWQPTLQYSLQALLTLLLLWLWRMLPVLRDATSDDAAGGAQSGGEAAANVDGEIILADALPGRIDTPGKIPHQKWGEPDSRTFMLRGRTYLRDSVKVASAQSLFQLVAVDYFKAAHQEDRLDVASRPDNWVYRLNQKSSMAPFTFVLNIVIPSQAPGLMALVMYFQPRSAAEVQGDSPEARLLRAFIAGDKEYRDERFKLFARTRGSPFIRRLIGVKPVLLGRKLKMPYFSGPNHFEVDIDVGSNTFAEYVTRVARDAVAAAFQLDMAFTLEGRTEAELPERMFGACHFNQLDLHGTGVQLPPRRDLPGEGSPRR
tara:strand:+ start:158 stop:1336 length:1179 start_codon:yes stop_codon:yes gene_type:complete